MSPDILLKIEHDFGQETGKAIELIEQAIQGHSYLNSERIVRCIVFIAEGNLDKLKETINFAILDPRDVMVWAEYSYDQNTLLRIRDFTKTFENCYDDVKQLILKKD